MPLGRFGNSCGELLKVPGWKPRPCLSTCSGSTLAAFGDGQIRTLQRRVKVWRATEGPAREVYFAQQHHPGRLSASDFIHMTDLGVTIESQTFLTCCITSC